jgi:divalent metal cation (Fe/Co/Zn/Cd) transporter
MAEGDPITLAVIYEDSVAVFGVVVAFFGIFMTRLTGKIYWDAFGSIIIGLMLAAVAVILINKNREVLISKCMPEHLKDLVLEVLENDPAIEKVIDFQSSMLDV